MKVFQLLHWPGSIKQKVKRLERRRNGRENNSFGFGWLSLGIPDLRRQTHKSREEHCVQPESEHELSIDWTGIGGYMRETETPAKECKGGH